MGSQPQKQADDAVASGLCSFVDLRVLAGQGADFDTTAACGRLVLGVFAAFAELEREMIIKRTKARLASARARGHDGRWARKTGRQRRNRGSASHYGYSFGADLTARSDEKMHAPMVQWTMTLEGK